ncbi:hypothetical protein GCM10011289_19910 [Paludibacterium paludis]|uniref:O-antigen ligase-related domain-containing protein n=2 Tax=Paludibacterium paludis TaxID=1225769 RepID=A0A918P3C1_9NEIS|nr:hypothetical protein GCM10011289_19910 [Paludibacterium paludis]
MELYNGKWLRVIETGFMGIAILPVVLAYQKKLDAVDIFWGIICAMWLVPLVQMLDIIWLGFKSHSIPWQETRIAYSRMELSVHVNLVLSFFATELTLRAALGKSWLSVKTPVLVFMFAVCVFVDLQLVTRNATVGMISMVVSNVIFVMLYRFRKWGTKKLILVALAGIVFLGALVKISLVTDPRWRSLAETVPYSLDIKNYKFWLNNEKYPHPRLASGEEVSLSNYERLAWAKVGIELVAKEPLGIGIGNDNFHRLVEKHFQEPSTTTQSHSGLLNFTFAAGIPGLLLWLMLIFSFAATGWNSFYREKKVVGLFLLMFILGFTSRSVFDDVLRDHMLEMFTFFSCLLLVICYREKSQAVECSDGGPSAMNPPVDSWGKHKKSF